MTSAMLTPQAFTNKRTFGEPRLHTDGEVLQVAFGKDGSLLSVEEFGIPFPQNPEIGRAHV